MTEQEYKQFREDFPSIIWWKGQVTSKRNYITTLYSWDKNGSHQKEIDEATDDYNNAKDILKEKLDKYKCKYDELVQHSKKLSAIIAR